MSFWTLVRAQPRHSCKSDQVLSSASWFSRVLDPITPVLPASWHASTSQTTRMGNARSQKPHDNKDLSTALVCQSHLFKLFLSSPRCMAIFGTSHNSCDFKIYSAVCYQFRQKTLWDFAQYHIHTWSPLKPCSAFRCSSSLVFILHSWLQLFTWM